MLETTDARPLLVVPGIRHRMYSKGAPAALTIKETDRSPNFF